MRLTRDDVPARVAEVAGGRRVRWLPAGHRVGDYDGRDRTLEIFDVAPREQRQLLRALRPQRSALEDAAGGPLIIIFHTPAESHRLYTDVELDDTRRARLA